MDKPYHASRKELAVFSIAPLIGLLPTKRIQTVFGPFEVSRSSRADRAFNILNHLKERILKGLELP
jgi:hypothetical protein